MFDEVYRIAIESNNFEELKRKLKKLHVDALTIKDGIIVTTGAQLAREGRNDKVEWMRQLGASVHDIAYGYALAGNHEQVEAYRTQHGASVNAIASGIARSRDNKHLRIFNLKRLKFNYSALESALFSHEGCALFNRNPTSIF